MTLQNLPRQLSNVTGGNPTGLERSAYALDQFASSAEVLLGHSGGVKCGAGAYFGMDAADYYKACADRHFQAAREMSGRAEAHRHAWLATLYLLRADEAARDTRK